MDRNMSVYGEDENDFSGTLFHSILMKKDWKVSPSSWTGTFAASNAGFGRDVTRRSRAP